MEQKLKKPRVRQLGDFSYVIESKDIKAERMEKRRGLIIREDGKVTTIPFNKTDASKRRPVEVRRNDTGKLFLSAKRQKITLRITLDRENDSPEEFRRIFDELINGYVIDVLKKEVEECLE